MSTIDPQKLHPNPANTIFDPLPEDIYQAFKDDIAQRGLLNPILVTPDFMIIAGHHRLKAAVELGRRDEINSHSVKENDRPIANR